MCLRTLLHNMRRIPDNGTWAKPARKHSTCVHIMMSQSGLRACEEWRRHQGDLPTQAEPIRRLIQLGLTTKALKSIK
jgi:hypothetical protein